METWEMLEARRSELARHAANKAGQAATFVKFHTDGQGAIEFEDGVDFECAYVEEPWMAYGSMVNVDRLRSLLGMSDDQTPPLPITSGHVLEWERSRTGLYVGCWVGVRVTFPSDIPVAPNIAVSIDHYFKWEAIGLKLIG